jgi:putative lipoprotein
VRWSAFEETMKSLCAALLSAIFVVACAGTQTPAPSSNPSAEASEPRVSGRLKLAGNATFPAPASVEVSLLDTSLADAPAQTIARLELRVEQGVSELPFELRYATDRIDPKAHLTLAARVSVDGALKYTTTESYPAITHGHASEGFELVLKPVN